METAARKKKFLLEVPDLVARPWSIPNTTQRWTWTAQWTNQPDTNTDYAVADDQQLKENKE